jgi:hypothetical protein
MFLSADNDSSCLAVEALLANRGVLLLEPQWLAFLAHNVPASPSRIAIKPDQDQQEAGQSEQPRDSIFTPLILVVLAAAFVPAEAAAGHSVSASLGFLVDLVQLIPAIKLIRMTDPDTVALPPSVHDLSIFRLEQLKHLP